MAGSHEVRGSIPLGSTKFFRRFGAFFIALNMRAIVCFFLLDALFCMDFGLLWWCFILGRSMRLAAFEKGVMPYG